MVQYIGFTAQEEQAIQGLVDRFHASDFRLGELKQVEKADLPGYDGKVIPVAVEGEDRLDLTMYLASCNPFTIAHELAHVSDIAVRRKDSLDNLSCRMPGHWHLAYKMSSEYYANRIACGYANGDDCFRAFKSDAGGLLKSAAAEDWGNFLIYYALLLGTLHGIDRIDQEPVQMVAPKHQFPLNVLKGMASFRHQSLHFFDSYGAPALADAA